MHAATRHCTRVAKVLIVEDDKRLADTVGDLLSSFGHNVEIAYDGPEALSVVEPFEPHVVFLDLSLPTLTGFEVARQIRETCGRAVRLVAYTGWADLLTRPISSLGFDAVLVKPATLDQILKVMGTD